MATIYDIAKLTGFSPTTVSKVINNYPDVSDKTRKKIKKALEENNFYPNAQAQFLTTKKTWTLGVVYYESAGTGLNHPFFSSVIDGFKKRADEHGYSLLLGSKNDRLKNKTFLEYFKHKNVEGIAVIAADANDNETIEIMDSDLPVVLIDRESLTASMVSSDNLEGCRLAIEYLYNLGHRKIAHITGWHDEGSWASNIRTKGYITSMARLGLKVPKEYISNGENFHVDGGYSAMCKLLELEDMPTAVFVSGDHMAVGAIEAIKDKGLRVPEDISIIGFDDIELARYITPKLTTVRQDGRSLGRAATDILIKQINEKKKFKIDEIIPVTLIERESCRKID